MEKKFDSSGYRQGDRKLHYGVMIDLAKPTTGVVQNNSVEWLYEDADQGIDLAWEEHVAECKGKCFECGEEESADVHEVEGGHDFEEDDGRCHDNCGPYERGTVLAGSWRKGEDGKYEPDETGEYAAIVGETCTQIVWSKTTRRVRALCSPCYPGQADLDSGTAAEGEGYLAYDLPREIYGSFDFEA